jgi:hypothetical protein
LRKHPVMTASEPSGNQPPGDDTALLIAALNHAWAWYDARINRGLQVVNYFLVASAVLATAYVSAINGKHYSIAAVIALSETALAAATYAIGRRQNQMAAPARLALGELRARIADRLTISTFLMSGPPRTFAYRFSTRIAFGLVVLLSVGAALYAVVH